MNLAPLLLGEETARTALLEDDLELNNVDLGKIGQRDLQAIIDAARLKNLHSNSLLRDKARLTVLHPMPRVGCGQSQLHHLASPCRDMSLF